MAHPNLQTNGASLEDCHTNFFALVTILVFILVVFAALVGVNTLS